MLEAAWWVGPLVTIVGVLVTQIVVLLLFYLRLRADDRRRWSQHKIDAYAVFFKTALRLRQDVMPDVPHIRSVISQRLRISPRRRGTP